MFRLFVLFCVAFCSFAQEEVIVEAAPESKAVRDEKAQLDDRKQYEKRLTDDLIKNGATSSEVLLYCKEEVPGTVQVFNQQIRVIENGVLKSIIPCWEKGEGDVLYKSSANTVNVLLMKDGTMKTSTASFEMVTTPLGLFLDDVLVASNDTKWDATQEKANRVRLSGPWPLGISAMWEMGYNRCKEIYELPKEVADLLGDSKVCSLRVAVETKAHFVLEDEGAYISVEDGEGHAIATLDTPLIKDSGGAHIRCAYSYTKDGVLGIDVPCEWLRDTARVWPIFVDPSTSGNASTTQQVCGTSGASGDRNRVWLRFDLPPINGSVSNVDFVMYLNTEASSNSWLLDLTTSATATAWDGATACSTMDAFTYYTPSVTVTISSTESLGNKTWANIGGTTNANSIVYQYDDATVGVCDPGNITVRVKFDTSGTTNKSDGIQYYQNSDADEIWFDEPTETNPPHLNITYTGTLSCSGSRSKASGSVGMISLNSRD